MSAPVIALRNAVLEEQITGQAINREQDHHLVNRTPEIDSLGEILLELARNSTGRRRRLALEGLRLVKQVRRLNDAELGCEQRTAGLAEQLSPQLLAARRRWSIKRLAAELRPLLADLANPLVRGDAQQRRMTRLVTIVAEAPAASLRSVALRHELGVRKFTLLQQLLDQTGALL